MFSITSRTIYNVVSWSSEGMAIIARISSFFNPRTWSIMPIVRNQGITAER